MAKEKTDKTGKILVIVESPAKAKSIGKYLGSRYKVVASVGHIRDLPKSTLGIDIDNDFEPKYITIRGKGDKVKELKKEAKAARRVMLATDPDREGEAISWHLAHLLDIDENDLCRIEFNEITKTAITAAAKNPRRINIQLVDAQQARRVMDRLVGYKISPLLWSKVRWGLSAGRVQSAALKIICDKERVIQAFVPEEYWPVSAEFKGSGTVRSFEAKLTEYQGKKIVVQNQGQAEAVVGELEAGSFIVDKIEEKNSSSKAKPPFTTSSMQQEASSRLNFAPKKTMFTAQQLYEGIQIKGEGMVGLVSYIRTDSVRVSDEAKGMAKDFIIGNFGEKYYSNNFYSNKKKDVQDAHEAIRPTSIARTPDSIKDSLTNDQYKLYKLIWCRFVASQMSPALFDVQNVVIRNGDYTFRVKGSRMRFDGYRKVYDVKDDSEVKLPPLEEGQLLVLKKIKTEQKFTQPPARFTEASLIRYLEEQDIGRPSTYAPIVTTLTDRKYIKREKKTLIPTELGFTVTELMENYFKDIVDEKFTAQMEDRLDSVETEGSSWKQLIREFYEPFSRELEKAEESIEKVTVKDEPTGENCELCGKPLVKKTGRFGEFIACSGYPECKNTKPIVHKIGVDCPKCGKDLVLKKSRRGRIFYGCIGYPNCDFVSWDKPANKKCPECGSIMLEKNMKSAKYVCSDPKCGHREKGDSETTEE